MAGLRDYAAAAVLRADNFERAKKFYTEVLALEEKRQTGPTREARFLAGDGTWISIYERPGMPAPQNTALAFEVPADKVETVVDELRSRGVVFEEYDIPQIGLKTVNGIADTQGTKAAWFKDTEGNVIVVGSA